MKKILIIGCAVMVIIISGIFTNKIYSQNSGRLHVVSLGDSITYGTGDPLKKGYTERFKEQYTLQKGIPVHLDNFGVPKYTTEDLLEQLNNQKVMNKIQKADYITLYIGTNDFRKSAERKFDTINIDNLEVGKNKYANNVNTILEKIRTETDAHVFVLGLYHPYTEFKNDQQLLTLIHQWNEEINKTITQFEGTTFIPILDLFQNSPKEDYFADSLHPNSAGYQQIANRVLEKVLLYENN
ncbi:GDSL-type esterase/lipase family protein [Cytobacillus sp. FJAT-54145]|uniref:GDSL-type esterase/lipase family protein n=1 Tax=Cytobacillus spartinae TaxID=3299023 RepID=A0ABW6KKV0_9BACI